MSTVKERLDNSASIFQKYDSPISITTRMAQFVVESQAGASDLFKKSNNGFGIKASAPWTGDSIPHNSPEVGGARVSEFRKYPTLEASIADNASFYTSTDYRANTAYKKAIDAENYEGEANALTGIYAGDPLYGQKLIKAVKDYNLTRYDKKESVKMTFPKPAMTDRRKHALGYPGHGVYARRSKSAIKNIVWHYTAVKRSLNRKIWDHEQYWKNTHKWDIGGYHYYIDSDGKIYWNYDLEIATYGASAANPYTMHISVEANSASDYSQAQIKAREDLTLWLLTNDLKHLTGQSMRGHKEVPGNSTSCPGYSVAQLNQFRADLDKKLKAGTPNKPANNDFDLPAYQTPTQAFKPLKVGDFATIREGQTYWYIPDGKGRKPSKDFAGDKDTISKVMDVEVGYSKRAYLLKDKVSWVLEQDLVEGRSDWSSEQKDQQEKLDYVYIDGVKRAIGDVIK